MKIKVWFLYLAGLVVGLVLGLVIPRELQVLDFFTAASGLAIRLVRVLFYPLALFSLAVSVCQLRRENRLRRYALRSTAYSIISAFILVLLGVLATLIVNPRRLRITSQEPLATENLGVMGVLKTLLPHNFFDLFQSGGDAFYVLALLAVVIGYHMHFDREIAEPAFNLFDSLSRIFYRINRYLLSINAIFIIPVTAMMVLIFRETTGFADYLTLILTLLTLSVIILFGLIPGILFALRIKENPFKVLLGMLLPILAGAVSSDAFYMAGHSLVSNNENLGIPRKMGAPIQSLGILFSRAGTALVSAVAMLFVLRAYSNLELTFFQVFWVFVFSLVTALLSFQNPTIPVYISLSLLCSFYGRGLEKGFLILMPVFPVLNRIAVLLDGAMVNFTAFVVSRKEDERNVIPVREFF